jgi:glyoxylase-like metal-dependent hydrolase (beta-lactamase superfamily II)
MFTRFSIPTPFQIGAVNAYLADRTLVDPGPDSEESWSALIEALAGAGLTPEDLERVIVTHAHPDHFGLAHRLRQRGVSVLATPAVAELIADFAGHFEVEREFFNDFLPRCGLGDDTAETVTALPEGYLHYAPSVETDRRVAAGDRIDVGEGGLLAEETSGHAGSELLLRYRTDEERRAIVGDHVLPEITPNPLLQTPPEPGGERPRMLPRYNDSLDRLAEEPLDRLLPGHRGVIDDPPGRIRTIRAAHEERTENVFALVDGPTTPVEVMEGLFDDLPATEVFSGMSEAIGHLDVLEARDRVRRRERGGLYVYERTQ